MFGREARLGLSTGIISPVLLRYLLWNGAGYSIAGAYLNRTATFDGKLATPHDYVGLTLAGTLIVTLRLGVYHRLDGLGGMVSGSRGLGF